VLRQPPILIMIIVIIIRELGGHGTAALRILWRLDGIDVVFDTLCIAARFRGSWIVGGANGLVRWFAFLMHMENESTWYQVPWASHK